MTVSDFNKNFYSLDKLLHNFAYNLTKSTEDAKDLFQETAMRALTNREKFREGTNFKAWTFTIMKNIFINNYRKKVRSKTIIDSTDNMYYINSNDNSTENGAESNIMMEELFKMVGELDETIRVPFLMHYKGFKYQEIADQLELPLGTVKSRIFFARKELKELVIGRYANIDLVKERIS